MFEKYKRPIKNFGHLPCSQCANCYLNTDASWVCRKVSVQSMVVVCDRFFFRSKDEQPFLYNYCRFYRPDNAPCIHLDAYLCGDVNGMQLSLCFD